MFFRNKNTLLAFGNIVALTVDSVNIRATCASALPTRSRSSWGPRMMATKIFKNMTRDIFGADASLSQINIQTWSPMCDIAPLFVYFSYVIPTALLAPNSIKCSPKLFFKCSTNVFHSSPNYSNVLRTILMFYELLSKVFIT